MMIVHSVTATMKFAYKPIRAEEYYEKETGHKVDGSYSPIDDTSLIWWLYGNRSSGSVQVTMDVPFRLIQGAKLCHDINNSIVVFDRSSPTVSYLIRNK